LEAAPPVRDCFFHLGPPVGDRWTPSAMHRLNATASRAFNGPTVLTGPVRALPTFSTPPSPHPRRRRHPHQQVLRPAAHFFLSAGCSVIEEQLVAGRLGSSSSAAVPSSSSTTTPRCPLARPPAPPAAPLT
jgi:hypothetical protein